MTFAEKLLAHPAYYTATIDHYGRIHRRRPERAGGRRQPGRLDLPGVSFLAGQDAPDPLAFTQRLLEDFRDDWFSDPVDRHHAAQKLG
jgi:hypothetical protein